MFSFALFIGIDKRHTTTESFLLFVKPGLNKRALEIARSVLEKHSIRTVMRAQYTGQEIQQRKTVEQQYSRLALCATAVEPSEIAMFPYETKAFRVTFGVQWIDVVNAGVVLNESGALSKLGVTPEQLIALCDNAEKHVRLGRGLYVCRIDRTCTVDPLLRKKLSIPLYVINWFYSALFDSYTRHDSVIDYFVCEWDESKISWTDMLNTVIGNTNPTVARVDSIRGLVHKDIGSVSVGGCGCGHNYVHVSRSALEGLVDRLLWKKGHMLYTDSFGARLLSARFKSSEINEWTKNPVVEEDKEKGKAEGGHHPLFMALEGKNSVDCIEYLKKL